MNSTSDLPPLSDVIRGLGLRATKRLGQNFIFDFNLCERIVANAGGLKDCVVVEIGGGPGGLTRTLLANGVAHVVVVEKDERFLPALWQIANLHPSRVTIIAGDALNFNINDISSKLPTNRLKIVANLPYNIATKLLVKWLTIEPWPGWYVSMTLMFQHEVAQRIVAQPGTKQYGRLSILCAWRCHARLCFKVHPMAFVPPPKVFSALVALKPKSHPLKCSAKYLEMITGAAFGQRRKMLRSSLRQLCTDPLKLLDLARIDFRRRGETLNLEEFVKLARLLEVMDLQEGN